MVWCVRVESGAFIARRKGKVFITGNSGFPKSLNVGKQIDAKITTGGSGPKNLHQRDMGEDYRPHDLAGSEDYGLGRMSRGADTDRDYKSAPPLTSPEALAWEGWGTALKPAWEPICMARKPLIGTVAENVLTHGTGALNIDGCRVETCENLNGGAYTSGGGRSALSGDDRVGVAQGMFQPGKTATVDYVQPVGRFPANIIRDDSDEVLEAFAAYGERVSGHFPKNTGGIGTASGIYGKGEGREQSERTLDSGTAARFFYCAKASKADRKGSKHPTVKPVALMRYLCRLITPPGGTVLDPFAGSGTTGEAAVEEGFNAVLIEREAEYCADIRHRLGFFIENNSNK